MNLRHPAPRRSAFTLVELLAVAAIVGVLAAILIPVLAAGRAQAGRTSELSAARQLMVGYHLYAGDHRGMLMPGRLPGEAAYNEGGNKVSMNEAATRWPHRLRPYLGDRFRSVLYVNSQAEHYDRLSREYRGAMLDYLLSLSPSFGLNERFVGGEGVKRIQDPVVVRLGDTAAPNRLIAFASTQNRGLGDDSGYFYVEAPAYWLNNGAFSTGTPENEQDYVRGYTAFRHGGRAVVAYLDGHVGLGDVAALRDMRLWSEQARLADNPDYRPSLAN